MRLLLGIAVVGIAHGLPACKRLAEVDAGGADSGPSPVASVSTAPIAAAAPDPCFVTDRAERSDLGRCYPDTLPESEWDVASSVELTASPATVTTTPGGIGDLVVHYANKTDAPVVLVFDDSPLRGHVVAHHADGRRADGTDAPPPAWARSWAHGVKRHQRVVLGPRAVLDERKMWFASSWSWAPNANQKQYPRSLLGPLPKGSYTLRVRTPLVVRSKGDRADYAEASTGARVE
jgi:hypothetical protein